MGKKDRGKKKTKWSLGKKISLGLLALLLAVLAMLVWQYYPAIKPVPPGEEIYIAGGGLPPGCVCHSKTLGLVRMHNQFSVEDCKKCHLGSERMAGKRSKKMTPERRAALVRRIKSEQICKQCHPRGEIFPVKKLQK